MSCIGRGWSRDRLSAEIPDIFIPLTQCGNAGGVGGRNENSGMTRWGEVAKQSLAGRIPKQIACETISCIIRFSFFH